MDDTTRLAFFDHVGPTLHTAETAGFAPPVAIVLPVELSKEGGYRVHDALFARSMGAVPQEPDPSEEQLLLLEAVEAFVRWQRHALERRLRAGAGGA